MEERSSFDDQDPENTISPPLPPRSRRKTVFFRRGEIRKGIELGENTGLAMAEYLCEIYWVVISEFNISVAEKFWLVQFDEGLGCEVITPMSSFPIFDELPLSSEYEIRCPSSRGQESRRVVEESRVVGMNHEEREGEDVHVSDWEDELVDSDEEVQEGLGREGKAREEEKTEEEYGDETEEEEEEEEGEEEEEEEETAVMLLTNENREVIINGEKIISNNPTWENDRYFQEYGELAIHVGMLGDNRRNLAYYNSIFSLKKDLLKGKVVLDVGCGTGILSCFCAKAGAARVYAVEASAMADNAQKVFEKNGVGEVVSLLRGRMEDVEVPEKVDLIVSEWMGCFLVFESMLESVLFARDRYLKEGGLMFPTSATLYLAPVQVKKYMANNVEVFSDVCGIDLSPLLPAAVKNACEKAIKSHNFPPESVISRPQKVMEMDLRTIKQSEFRVLEAEFSFDHFREEGVFDGFAVWFDVRFSCEGENVGDSVGNCGGEGVEGEVRKEGGSLLEKEGFPWAKERLEEAYEIEGGELVFSTSPAYGKTHWGQDVFLFTDVPSLSSPSSSSCLSRRSPKEINGKFVYSQNGYWRRHWDVDFSFSIDGVSVHKHFLL